MTSASFRVINLHAPLVLNVYALACKRSSSSLEHCNATNCCEQLVCKFTGAPVGRWDVIRSSNGIGLKGGIGRCSRFGVLEREACGGEHRGSDCTSNAKILCSV
jgi:hypothetical protein